MELTRSFGTKPYGNMPIIKVIKCIESPLETLIDPVIHLDLSQSRAIIPLQDLSVLC